MKIIRYDQKQSLNNSQDFDSFMCLTIFVELWSEILFFPKQSYTAQKRTESICKEVKLRPVTGIKYAAKSSIVPHPHNKDDLFP